MSKHKIGDIVEINGQSRIITMVGSDFFQSVPYENTEPEIEMKEVVNLKKRRKKNNE